MMLILLTVFTVAEDPDLFLQKLKLELKKRGNPWVAGTTGVSHLPMEQRRALLGIGRKLVPPKIKGTKKTYSFKKLPPSWDWRNVDGKCWLTRVKEQNPNGRGCLWCWAFGWVAMLEARYNIQHNLGDNADFDLSEQFIISCNTRGCRCGTGCAPYHPDISMNPGVPLEECFPFVDRDAPCGDRCRDSEKYYKIVDHGRVDLGQPTKQEIVEGGPVVGYITIKEDFLYYKGGTYIPILGEKSNHIVCIVGWLSDGRWIFKNSYGADWGIEGCYGERGYGLISVIEHYNFWVTMETKNMLSWVGVEFVEEKNQIWDPGDTIEIVITLKAVGSNFENVTATLSTSDNEVEVISSTSEFGDISANTTGDNKNTPFVAWAIPQATEHEVEFTLKVNSEGKEWEYGFEIPIGVKKYEVIDIPAGEGIVVSISSRGSIGKDSILGEGVGFQYKGRDRLYYGAMALGSSSSYLVDNFYTPVGCKIEWQTVEKLRWESPPEEGDTFCYGEMNDRGYSSSRGVSVVQKGWSFEGEEFVVVEYTYKNNSSQEISDLISACFVDFDVSEGGGKDDAGVEEEDYLGWMKESGGNVYVGLVLVYPSSVKNISVIPNSDYVHPQDKPTEEDKWKFMDGRINFKRGNNGDYGIIISTEKFTLPSQGEYKVAYAFVPGESLEELKENAKKARESYGIEEKGKRRVKNFNLKIEKENKKVRIRFSLKKEEKVRIIFYNVAGRVVKRVVDKRLFPGNYEFEYKVKTRGILFLKVNLSTHQFTKKIVIL